MDAFQIQMERAHQTAKAKQGIAAVIEALRIANSLTRALIEPDGSSMHADIVEIDDMHIAAQSLGASIVQFDGRCQISGMPGDTAILRS